LQRNITANGVDGCFMRAQTRDKENFFPKEFELKGG
jgi:hypothetical protein